MEHGVGNTHNHIFTEALGVAWEDTRCRRSGGPSIQANCTYHYVCIRRWSFQAELRFFHSTRLVCWQIASSKYPWYSVFDRGLSLKGFLECRAPLTIYLEMQTESRWKLLSHLHSLMDRECLFGFLNWLRYKAWDCLLNYLPPTQTPTHDDHDLQRIPSKSRCRCR